LESEWQSFWSQDGLPISSFRTDDWPMLTAAKKQGESQTRQADPLSATAQGSATVSGARLRVPRSRLFRFRCNEDHRAGRPAERPGRSRPHHRNSRDPHQSLRHSSGRHHWVAGQGFSPAQQHVSEASRKNGWADYPAVNLWNKDGLPASPFRTDDWPMITAGKK